MKYLKCNMHKRSIYTPFFLTALHKKVKKLLSHTLSFERYFQRFQMRNSINLKHVLSIISDHENSN